MRTLKIRAMMNKKNWKPRYCHRSFEKQYMRN